MPRPRLIITIATLLAIPVMALYGFARHHLFNYRLRRASKSRQCPSCGGPLGLAAMHAADNSWRARPDVHLGDPVIMVIHRRVFALCTCCGVGLGFREELGVFELAETDTQPRDAANPTRRDGFRAIIAYRYGWVR